MKFNKIFAVICLSALIVPMGLMAKTQNPTDTITIQQEDKVVNIGILKEYIVDLDSNNMYITRDGAKSDEVHNGDIIDNFGNYTICMKDSGKLVKFSIEPKQISEVRNFDELYEVIYTAGAQNDKKLEFSISSDYDGNVSDDINDIAVEYRFENPWITNKVQEYLVSGNTATIWFKSLIDVNTYDTVTNKVKKELDKYIEQLDLTKKDVELEIEVVSWIIDRAKYKEGEIVIGDETHNLQNLANSDQLVCDGYAKVMMYILNTIGIPNEMIIGEVVTGAHAWNLVQLDDGYYHVDVTWADNVKHNDFYFNYVNENDEQLSKTHKWETGIYPKANGENYLNTKIFDFISLEDVNNNNLNKPIIIRDTDTNPITQDILIKSPKQGYLPYYQYDKYGDTVILLCL